MHKGTDCRKEPFGDVPDSAGTLTFDAHFLIYNRKII